jgi:azurin
MEGDVIAHTQKPFGGETTDIEFTAPAKGTYDFLCSFPVTTLL